MELAPDAMLAEPTFEVFPARGVEAAAAQLPPGARVAVSCSPRRGLDATLELCERLSRHGLEPVPHLAARLVRGHAELERLVQRLAALRLREVFVVGGDAPAPAGPYPSALALLRGLAAAGADLRRVGVAAYPAGHPFLDDETLLRSLGDKQPLASYLVTQLCFDPEAIARWVAGARRRGIRLPVHVGLPGVVSTGKLLRFALRIGVATSARMLARHADLAGRLLAPGEYRPDALLGGLASALQGADQPVEALHLYTFNEVGRTEAWRWQRLHQRLHASAT